MHDTLPPHPPTPSFWTRVHRDLRRDLAHDLRPARLVAGLNLGIITGILAIILVIALSALVLSGELSGYAGFAIRLALLGAVFVSVVVTLMSSHGSTTAVGQDAPTALMAFVVAGALASAPPGLTPDERFFTVLMLVIVTTLLTGITFLLVGRFRWGGLVRFLPYPVIGGFLAGTGWLLLVGAIHLMADGVEDSPCWSRRRSCGGCPAWRSQRPSS